MQAANCVCFDGYIWSAALLCCFAISALFSSLLGASFPNRLQDLCDGFGARFGAEIAFAVDADADRVGFHFAICDYEHGVHFHLLGALDFAVDLIAAFVEFSAYLMSAQFVQNRSRVLD